LVKELPVAIDMMAGVVRTFVKELMRPVMMQGAMIFSIVSVFTMIRLMIVQVIIMIVVVVVVTVIV